MPTIDPIQHLTQQQSAPQQTLPPTNATILHHSTADCFPATSAEPDRISSSLTINEMNSALPSMNDPSPAEASDSHDHHHHHHQQLDHLNEQSLSQRTNRKRTLIWSNPEGWRWSRTVELRFRFPSPPAAAVLSPVARIQQRDNRTTIRNVPSAVVLAAKLQFQQW